MHGQKNQNKTCMLTLSFACQVMHMFCQVRIIPLMELTNTRQLCGVLLMQDEDAFSRLIHIPRRRLYRAITCTPAPSIHVLHLNSTFAKKCPNPVVMLCRLCSVIAFQFQYIAFALVLENHALMCKYSWILSDYKPFLCYSGIQLYKASDKSLFRCTRQVLPSFICQLNYMLKKFLLFCKFSESTYFIQVWIKSVVNCDRG